ncbi:MAG TPA: alanine--glyoxylate aminotransferase family protein [Candidatus Binataceae bacterium]|nr:alanine--glyoxylate aminotransferase family protein [Candidatus Binataceae bacterium]
MANAPELNPTQRTLLGPGPSNVHPRVMRAMMAPVVGHLDPDFALVMDELRKLLRGLFQTGNELTFPVSGTGSAGMEAALANLIEDGDEVVIGVNGVFGGRAADCAERMGARVHRVESPWGRIIEPGDIAAALKQIKRPKLVMLIHAETSTGVWQPVEEISHLTHEHGAMLVLDTVTSLGCVPVEIDSWRVDASYSCTQKGISAPPGLAPITFSPAARDLIRARKQKCRSWYFDIAMIEQYWSKERVYHHTAPITMTYALYEGLRLAHEEGLEARFRRHRENGAALGAGLSALGLAPTAQEGHRLPQLAVVNVPAGIDEAAARRELLLKYNIEIAGGLGPFRGKVWRIGTLGESSRRQHVAALLAALESIIAASGHDVRRGAALAAADKVYASWQD